MKALSTALLATLMVSAPGQAITSPYVDPVWRPFIMLAGDGDPQHASERLERIKLLQNTMVNHTRVDDDTQAFVDAIWRSMEKFDLKGFYKLLPEQEGRRRQLNVSGRWAENEYRYSTVKKAQGGFSADPMPLGDVNINVTATELQNLTLSSRYLLQGNVRAGVGASNWQIVRDAGNEVLNAASFSPKQFLQVDETTEIAMRKRAGEIYPSLGTKDVDFLLPLWHAFPHLADLVVSMANIEDVVVEDDNNKGYREYTLVLALDQAKLEKLYPHFSKYLKNVDDLVNATIDLYDENGRLMRLGVNTETWRLTLNTVLSFGGIVPRTQNELLLDKVRRFGDAPVAMRVNVDADIDVLGILTQVSELQANFGYVPNTDRLTLESNINVVPNVKVEGAFLNIVPARVIDAFIPGNIAEIITEFFRVACEGNMGQGIVANLALENTNVPGVIDAKVDGTVLAIDNPFVQIGMRIFNTRMIPGDKASEDIRRLFFASQQAFYDDFDLFMAQQKL